MLSLLSDAAHPRAAVLMERNMIKYSLGCTALLCAFMAGCGSDSSPTTTTSPTNPAGGTNKTIASVSVSPDITTLNKGAVVKFRASVKYADGSSDDITDSPDTVWNTSAASVATVSSDGNVTAVSAGVVNISVQYKGESGDEHFAVMP